MLPDIIIIGAMKCGTSSLFRYLASHPDIVPSSHKETDFFRSEETFARGLRWYESLFRGKGSHALEASPNYSKHPVFPGVAKRMYAVVPDARLIYLVRDPVARAVSHYVHNLVDGLEDRPFSEAIQNPDGSIIATSLYSLQVQAFLEHYPSGRIHVVQAEELSRDPETVVRALCEALGLPARCDPAVVGKRLHETSDKRRPCRLERCIQRSTRNRVVRDVTQFFLRGLGQPVRKPQVTEADLEVLRGHFSADVDALRRFAGRDFPGWSVTGS